MEIEYDSNGNRKKIIKKIRNKRQENDVLVDSKFYDVNKLNQYESIGDLKLSYDKNGDLKLITNKSSIESYSYYPDGKLYKYDNGDEDCVYKYDCLERLEKITCRNLGVFQIGYHFSSKFDQLFYVTLPNKSVIYFTQLPSIGLNGFIHDEQFYLIERNENFQTIQLINNKNEQKTRDFEQEFLKYMDPFESIDASYPFDLNTFRMKINKNMLLSENNKPSFVSSIGRDLGIKSDAPLTLNFYEIESKKNHPLEYFVTDGFRSKLSERIIDLNLLQLPETTSGLLLTDIYTDLNDLSVNFELRKTFTSYILSQKANESHRNDRFKHRATLVSDICSTLAQAGYEYFGNGKNASTVGKEVLTSLLTIPELAAVSNAVQTGDYYGSLSSYMADKITNGVVDELAIHFLSYPFLKNPAVQCSSGIIKYFLPKFLAPIINSTLHIARPKDPNEMIGPLGYGPESFIIYNQEFMSFSIYFKMLRMQPDLHK